MNSNKCKDLKEERTFIEQDSYAWKGKILSFSQPPDTPWGELEKSCSYLETRHAKPSSSTDSSTAFV